MTPQEVDFLKKLSHWDYDMKLTEAEIEMMLDLRERRVIDVIWDDYMNIEEIRIKVPIPSDYEDYPEQGGE